METSNRSSYKEEQMSVSVVIPAYNAEAFIHRALESVFGQTMPVDEIIVVDDGSTDRTCSIVESYGDRVRLISQQNQRQSAARNLGVRSATSEFIAFLDADDAWDREKVEKQLACIAGTPHAVLCYTGVRNLNIDGSTSTTPAPSLKTLAWTLRLSNPGITTSCVLLRREAFVEVGGFDVRLKGVEDWELWLRLLESGPFCVVDEPLTLYQMSTTGVSANAELLFDEARKMVDSRLLVGLHGFSRWLWRRRIVSYQAYRAALTCRATGKQAAERRFMLQSIVLWPSPLWHPRRFKTLAVTLRNTLRRPEEGTTQAKG